METRWQHCPRGPVGWTHVPLQVGAGTLLVVGGGGTPPVVHDLFFHLAGGAAARVLHIPSATGMFDEIEDKRAYYCEFYDRNPASFAFLHTYDRAVAETRAFAAPLDQATGVWMGGGSQSRLAELFQGTEVVAGLHRLLARGGVVAGTSSGTAIVSDAMICCGYGYEEIEFGPGFSLYPGAVVDPHFSGRRRQKRMGRAMLRRPDLVGIGIDEQTALVVQGGSAGVVGFGGGSVWFHFADPGTEAVYRYRLGLGETLVLPAPVLGTSAPALEEGLRAIRPPDILTVADLSPDPLEGYPVKDLLARREVIRASRTDNSASLLDLPGPHR
jgi:cyanophycinase